MNDLAVVYDLVCSGSGDNVFRVWRKQKQQEGSRRLESEEKGNIKEGSKTAMLSVKKM